MIQIKMIQNTVYKYLIVNVNPEEKGDVEECEVDIKVEDFLRVELGDPTDSDIRGKRTIFVYKCIKQAFLKSHF